MYKKNILIAYSLIMFLSTISCNSVVPEPNTHSVCSPVPEDFKATNLVGTWTAEYGINQIDMLMIKEDNTYKQIYINGSNRYESNWMKWWLETRKNGLMRLHLEGMRRCDDVKSICDREGGGVDPQKYTAVDYCENDVVEMPNSVVLIVTGVSYKTPTGIVLRQTRLAGSDWTWSFELKQSK